MPDKRIFIRQVRRAGWSAAYLTGTPPPTWKAAIPAEALYERGQAGVAGVSGFPL